MSTPILPRFSQLPMRMQALIESQIPKGTLPQAQEDKLRMCSEHFKTHGNSRDFWVAIAKAHKIRVIDPAGAMTEVELHYRNLVTASLRGVNSKANKEVVSGEKNRFIAYQKIESLAASIFFSSTKTAATVRASLCSYLSVDDMKSMWVASKGLSQIVIGHRDFQRKQLLGFRLGISKEFSSSPERDKLFTSIIDGIHAQLEDLCRRYVAGRAGSSQCASSASSSKEAASKDKLSGFESLALELTRDRFKNMPLDERYAELEKIACKAQDLLIKMTSEHQQETRQLVLAGQLTLQPDTDVLSPRVITHLEAAFFIPFSNHLKGDINNNNWQNDSLYYVACFSLYHYHRSLHQLFDVLPDRVISQFLMNRAQVIMPMTRDLSIGRSLLNCYRSARRKMYSNDAFLKADKSDESKEHYLKIMTALFQHVKPTPELLDSAAELYVKYDVEAPFVRMIKSLTDAERSQWLASLIISPDVANPEQWMTSSKRSNEFLKTEEDARKILILYKAQLNDAQLNVEEYVKKIAASQKEAVASLIAVAKRGSSIKGGRGFLIL